MQPAKAETAETPTKDMKDIVALCKRRGFVFPASDIYGGINGFWDYGPMGVELKNNMRDLWWKRMVLCPPIGPDGHPVQIVGVDSSIIQNPKAWVASGHVGGFSDPMVDDRETKLRYREDKLKVATVVDKKGENFYVAFDEDADADTISKRMKKLGINYDGGAMGAFEKMYKDVPNFLEKVIGPDASKVGTLTPPKQFNLMFQTYVGATADEDSKAYLRPETAQGIFLNYKNVLDSSRVKVPFGIAQIGKAFRNEVNPRNFIFRSREFEQMELEWFCEGKDAAIWQKFWFEERKKFWKDLGLSDENLQMRNHDSDELSHYAKAGLGTADIEYKFPFTAPVDGAFECITHRCDFDLTQHAAHSGTKTEYMDPEDNTKRCITHISERSGGLTRGVMAWLC